MKLVIVRHGECEANARGVVAGSRDDSPLTQHGIDEAEQTAQQLKGFTGRIVSSPLQRACKTAEIIRDAVMPGTVIDIEPLFIERNVGDATGKPQAEYFAMEKSDVPIPNAETPQQMADRVRAGLEKLKATNRDTLLVTHNGTYRILVCVLQGLDPNEFANVPSIQNCEVKEFVL